MPLLHSLPIKQARAWGVAVAGRYGLLRPGDAVITCAGSGTMPGEGGLQVSLSRVSAARAAPRRP